MELLITTTFTLPLASTQRVLEFVKAQFGGVASIKTESANTDQSSAILPFRVPFNSLAALLDEKTRAIVDFIVSRNGQFFNDELAALLEIDDQLTSLYLGQLTKKLRKIGTQADGFRGAANWYSKRRSSGRTLLTVRPDVLEIMKATLPKP